MIVPGADLMACVHAYPGVVVVVSEVLGGVGYAPLEGDFAFGGVGVYEILFMRTRFLASLSQYEDWWGGYGGTDMGFVRLWCQRCG